ncbi:hypothetical protein KQI76_08910 [Amphibacillus sp. MSJ-3]|uniref:DUF6884 domain-containing protein n=1 Tax=Amphibacillus sp. MSJ-3 TaxID=2841505 RepID=UPI001C0E9E87|nr:DUF6884 domain-containing protein [Amphibacillus sp. MSJ-3]MBU5595273.1 hypothetical protein [Amphibacillus sp. MSJ-3]
MTTLAILPCGKKKVWDLDPSRGKVKVREAYVGTLHQLTRQYAEMFCDQWVILSAKHGYCFPNEIIDKNYDLTFGMPKSEMMITNEQLKKQIKEKRLDQYDQIIVLTGKKHKVIVEQTFNQENQLSFPLLGTRGIGEMQQRLKQAIIKRQPLHK